MTLQETLDEMERKAKAATPGPWKYRPVEGDDWGFVRGWDMSLVAVGRGGNRNHDECRRAGIDPYGPNAEYIASLSPSRVLALIEVARAAKKHIATLTAWGASPLDNAAKFGDDFIPPTDEELRLQHVALIAALSRLEEKGGSNV